MVTHARTEGMARLADVLRRSPLLRATKRRVARHVTGRDPVRIVQELPAFAPYSAGHFPARADLTLLAAQQTFPLLLQLVRKSGRPVPEPLAINQLHDSSGNEQATQELKRLLDEHGSDKATDHDYHLFYSWVLSERSAVRSILEIGLGTNRRDVVSTMGATGRPGASLRAFRDFLPAATVFGADIDKRILFTEERIRTGYVDQTRADSFAELAAMVGEGLDLIIDDGLHAPNANLAVLLFALGRVRVGGWIVIEDIAPEAISIWQVIAALLPESHEPRIIKARGGALFAVQRIE